MASWTSQSTSSLLPGEPWTSAKALAAFENPTALAEGASGAPKIQEAAMDEDSVNRLAIKDGTASGSGSLGGSSRTTVTITDELAFTPKVTGTDIQAYLGGGGLIIENRDPDSSSSYTYTWKYIAS
jgi:hypothetical protein